MGLNSKSLHLDAKKILATIGRVWKKIHTFLFYFLMFSAVTAGAIIWRNSVYGEGWSQLRKQEYLNTQKQGVIFKENGFKETIKKVQERENENLSPYPEVKDIYRSYN